MGIMSNGVESKARPLARLSRCVVETLGAVVLLSLLAAGPALAQGQYTFGERNMKKMIKVVGLLEEGRTAGYTEAEISILIGNEPARAAYVSAGFASSSIHTDDGFEAQVGCPGIESLTRAL